jgi:hypothetical protein
VCGGLGGRGYVRFKKCRVIRRVFGAGVTVRNTTKHLPPQRAKHERIAALRVEAIRAGKRQLPLPSTTDPVDRLVIEKLAASSDPQASRRADLGPTTVFVSKVVVASEV